MAHMEDKILSARHRLLRIPKKWLWAGMAGLFLFAGGFTDSHARDSPEPIALTGITTDPAMAFGHYTFATMWFPGVCRAWNDSSDVCNKERHNSAVNQQLTLHGLWPSRPKSLIDAGVEAPEWWHYGCYWFDNDKKIPESANLPPLELPGQLKKRLNQVMPLTQTYLDRHEYTKHIACFGPTPTEYFSTATNMLAMINTSYFAHWISAHRGQMVTRKAIQAAFKKGFKQPNARAMQLRCASNSNNTVKDVLTEIWFTIPTEKLAQFPKPSSFGSGLRGNCAEKIHILNP